MEALIAPRSLGGHSKSTKMREVARAFQLGENQELRTGNAPHGLIENSAINRPLRQ